MDLNQKIIWFAGFYEGEGSISNDICSRNSIRVSISQNDRTPLDIGKEIWGGSIRTRVRKTLKGKICHGHEWVLYKKDALKFIDDIKPYMIIPYKIKQVQICLKKSKEKWNRKFKCNFCYKEYSDPSGRRRHEKKEHINKGEIFKCDLCNNKYKSKDSLNRHIKLNHKPDASTDNNS